jgi:CheY-like chemotaxis protein
MPVMDGFQCAREIRQFEQSKALPPVPIVALTAEGRSQDRENCLNAGMDDFLSKPIDLAQFTDTLKKWLRPKMTKQEENLVNWSSLEKMAELKADGRPLDMALVEEFLRTSTTLVEELEDAIRSENAQRTRELAHAVKSPARTVGLVALGDLCESIEDGKCDATTSRKLTDVHARSIVELKNYLRRRSAQAA